jgi:hypothetical protein
MTSPPFSKLPEDEQQQFLNDLNYLNLGEIKSFCKRLAIPYKITIETGDGVRSGNTHWRG